MNKLLVLCLVLFSFQLLAEDKKKIYKYVDKDGAIYYSETKKDDKYEELDDLPELSVVPSLPAQPSNKSFSEPDRKISKSGFEKKQTVFKITTPADQESLWGTGGKLSVTVALSAEQQQRTLVQILIDGEKQKPNKNTTQVFSDIYRGEHKVVAHLLDRNSGRLIKKSKEITVYMHQNSRK
ncbi:MAG: hypothetical protein L3J22_03625 [Xanthomonadales bacterium]|nr:hypothetical protein [Xanthomonadales bacterium]